MEDPNNQMNERCDEVQEDGGLNDWITRDSWSFIANYTYSLYNTSLYIVILWLTLIFKQTIYLQFDCQFDYANSPDVQQITLMLLWLRFQSLNGKRFSCEGDIFPVLRCRALFLSAVLVCQRGLPL